MANNNATTVRIEGMMCPHCEAAVTKALSAVSGVTVLSVSHEKGAAEVTREAGVTDAALSAAVTGAGYQVTAIEG